MSSSGGRGSSNASLLPDYGKAQVLRSLLVGADTAGWSLQWLWLCCTVQRLCIIRTFWFLQSQNMLEVCFRNAMMGIGQRFLNGSFS